MKILLLLVLTLGGCALVPTRPPEVSRPPEPTLVPTVNGPCATLARVVRRIAVVRDAGVTAEDALLVVADGSDEVGGAPLEVLVREVYGHPDISPGAGAVNSYGTCVRGGYDNMVAALRKAHEERAALEAQRAKEQAAKRRAKAPAPTKGKK